MAALFALGVMSIGWMALVAALDRRRAPAAVQAHGQAGGRGRRWRSLGLAVALAPGDVPGLTLPDSQDAAGMTMTMQQ